MRFPLVQLPTPLHRLPRLSDQLGIDLWIKRDDLTGFAMGGNKGRKLEFLIGRALQEGATAVVTCGSLQSNFIRQLGAACAVAGLRCAAAVMKLPYEATVGKPGESPALPEQGNVILDRLVGLDLRPMPDGDWETLFAAADDLADEYRSQGEQVYQIPVGGSSPWGAHAFLLAGQELDAQSPEPFDWIVTASSSGSTHTGLATHFRGTRTRVQGIACDPEPDLILEFEALSKGLGELTGDPRPLLAGDFLFDLRFVGPGYGIPSESGWRAIERLARTEGIFLDPIYSGKGFDGLLTMAEEGSLGGRVCFWHTGGTPGLFAYPR